MAVALAVALAVADGAADVLTIGVGDAPTRPPRPIPAGITGATGVLPYCCSSTP